MKCQTQLINRIAIFIKGHRPIKPNRDRDIHNTVICSKLEPSRVCSIIISIIIERTKKIFVSVLKESGRYKFNSTEICARRSTSIYRADIVLSVDFLRVEGERKTVQRHSATRTNWKQTVLISSDLRWPIDLHFICKSSNRDLNSVKCYKSLLEIFRFWHPWLYRAPLQRTSKRIRRKKTWKVCLFSSLLLL